MDLNAYSILRPSPEGLDSKVLLNPFEEEPNLPSIAVQMSDIFGIEVEVVGVVGKGSLPFRRIVDDSPEFRRIVVSVVHPMKRIAWSRMTLSSPSRKSSPEMTSYVGCPISRMTKNAPEKNVVI